MLHPNSSDQTLIHQNLVRLLALKRSHHDRQVALAEARWPKHAP